MFDVTKVNQRLRAHLGVTEPCTPHCDFLIEDLIVLELKSVSNILDVHKFQVLNYMNLLKVPKGILVNFNVKNLYHHGQETFINKYYDELL